ncbi:MAG TPA: ABC transporter ATP-binding protein, partial [Methylomirabilota bacterium]|nr:ABC transporter ATP-binding protein [Methylomirabilota bacterium]
ESLIEALNAFEGAVILISHDRHLVETTADRLWLVADGRVAPFEGDMDDYKRFVLSGPDAASRSRGDARPNANERRKMAADKRAQLAPLRKRIQAAEKRIEDLKRSLKRLDDTLAAPALFTDDPARATKFSKERADTLKAIDRAEEEWLELSGTIEAAEAG